jgi:zinc transport system substrate-binding protein
MVTAMKIWTRIALTLTFLSGLTSIGCGQTSQPAAKIAITVSILPQKYFVERVGGPYVETTVIVGPGADAHTYEPKPEQLKALSKASAYLRIHIDFEEAWMPRFSSVNPKLKIVDTLQGIQRLPMRLADEHSHENEVKDEHSQDNLDPHVWLSPKLVKLQAQTIYQTLIELDPAHQEAYLANLNAFNSDLTALDTTIRKTFQALPQAQRKFMVFHPSWGYFAHDYGLEQIPVEIGGQEPSAAELSQLITQAKATGIKVIFVQPQFSQRSAEMLANEIGGQVISIDPLAADWLANMQQVVQTFNAVLQQK